MKILLTGFEPFDNNALNPSQLVIEEMKKIESFKAKIFTSLLPVDTKAMPNVLITKIKEIAPDIVISLGLATGRPVISLERVAINLLDFRIPDNKGNQVIEQPIVINAPDAYFSTLPVSFLYNNLSSKGIPCEVSYTAGTYLCNQAFYLLMHHSQTTGYPKFAGFIHLPALPEQVGVNKKAVPSMSFQIDLEAINIILKQLISQE